MVRLSSEFVMKKRVLAIGLDPYCADLSAFPGLSPELVRNYIEAQIQKLDQAGFMTESCLIDRGATAEDVVARVLRSRQFDCVVIGAGLREPADLLQLFEKILNLVHVLAPGARICFNTTPADTLEAVHRWMK